MPIPYERATSGGKARDEITRLLKAFGCTSVGFMDNFDAHEVILAFEHRGRRVQLKASAKGWAELYVRSRKPKGPRQAQALRETALRQGQIAVSSMLRDWVKGQVTAVECGMLSFEAVFMPYVLTSDGRPLVDRVIEAKLLPAPS